MERLAARVNVTANETLVVVTDTVSVAVYKPPDSAPSTLNDITAYFIPLGKMGKFSLGPITSLCNAKITALQIKP